MTSLVDTIPSIQLPTVVPLGKSSPKSDFILDNNDPLVEQLSHRYEKSSIVSNIVPNGPVTVLLFGQPDSSLRDALIEHLIPLDITLILFSTEEQLWCWLNTNRSMKVASLVIETNMNIENILSQSHAYKSIIRSILIRCKTNELNSLQQVSRSYMNIDGIYDDDVRVLIRLAIDLALVSEEIGDEQRDDKNNELEAQRNYDRALKLCTLARRL